jgi:hypothetical protein
MRWDRTQKFLIWVKFQALLINKKDREAGGYLVEN